jgi:hypothetical protein
MGGSAVSLGSTDPTHMHSIYSDNGEGPPTSSSIREGGWLLIAAQGGNVSIHSTEFSWQSGVTKP